ncbi:MAG: diguanylate cyclase [Solirubrobacteraceae bacterium]
MRRVYARMSMIHQGQTQQLVREVWARADLMRERRRLESQAAEASHQAEQDALTGIGNRRLLARFVQEATVRQAEIAIVIVDLDRFKEINDSLGHDVGDLVLQRVAQILETRVRAGQVAIRYGGDEFVLALSSVSPSSAAALAERIRAAIAAQNWASLRPGLAITATLGVAIGPASRSQAVLSAADAALYAAKQSGRNTIGTGPTS